jgi:hypothetical protein
MQKRQEDSQAYASTLRQHITANIEQRSAVQEACICDGLTKGVL